MKINTVKTAFKIADVELVPNSTKLNFNYLNDLKDENGQKLPQSILRENYARVYIIVVDAEIKKSVGIFYKMSSDFFQQTPHKEQAKWPVFLNEFY